MADLSVWTELSVGCCESLFVECFWIDNVMLEEGSKIVPWSVQFYQFLRAQFSAPLSILRASLENNSVSQFRCAGRQVTLHRTTSDYAGAGEPAAGEPAAGERAAGQQAGGQVKAIGVPKGTQLGGGY